MVADFHPTPLLLKNLQKLPFHFQCGTNSVVAGVLHRGCFLQCINAFCVGPRFMGKAGKKDLGRVCFYLAQFQDRVFGKC